MSPLILRTNHHPLILRTIKYRSQCFKLSWHFYGISRKKKTIWGHSGIWKNFFHSYQRDKPQIFKFPSQHVLLISVLPFFSNLVKKMTITSMSEVFLTFPETLQTSGNFVSTCGNTAKPSVSIMVTTVWGVLVAQIKAV